MYDMEFFLCENRILVLSIEAFHLYLRLTLVLILLFALIYLSLAHQDLHRRYYLYLYY